MRGGCIGCGQPRNAAWSEEGVPGCTVEPLGTCADVEGVAEALREGSWELNAVEKEEAGRPVVLDDDENGGGPAVGAEEEQEEEREHG